eukprot:COSAG01_NODE_29479_length_636_cov_1.713222_1_plen_145_part_01
MPPLLLLHVAVLLQQLGPAVPAAAAPTRRRRQQQQQQQQQLPTCHDHVAGLGLLCNASCVCPHATGCVPVPSFSHGAAKCMPTYDDVEVVHVINSCHLDIGFVNSSVGIINLYFDHHIPLAISVGKELRAGGAGVADFTDHKLNF